LPVDLSNNQRAALRRAVLNGDYHLLLGAGASRESISPQGVSLPTGPELGSQMTSAFEIMSEPGDLLWRLYARTVAQVSEREVYKWLRERFWNVSPPEWMKIFARTPWAVIWTLNIDDTFEQSYNLVKSEASRPLLTLNWDDEFRLGRELSAVHLHGSVCSEEPRKLVFSLSEYATAAAAAAAWPLNFRDIYGVSPFVIIGARLRDEPDIEAVISNRKPTHDAPSFYVSPHISPAVERDLLTWNLVPVRMTARKFSELWPELTGLDLTEPPTPREEIALRVGRQFSELKTNAPGKRPKGHDFIGGDEPRWIDICQDLYAQTDWIRQAREDCRRLGGKSPPSNAIIYVGRRLTGRTTGLLAMARELRRRSWRTFLYVGDGRPDMEAVIQFGADGKSIALLFDSVADIADDVAWLLKEARASGLSITCAAVDQTERAASIVGHFNEVYLLDRHIGTINSRLTNTDAARVVDKLQMLGRLGILEEVKQDRKRRAHFRNHGLFDGMAQLENAPGFGRRVGQLIDSISDPEQIKLIYIASMAARFGRRLHIIDAGRMLALDSEGVAQIVRDALGSILEFRQPWVATRHRWMALEPCIERLGSQAALTFLGEAMRRVGSRLGRASQRERNATSMLIAAFMSYNNLAELFPDTDLDAWYEELSASFGTWSARYWEQRAIMSRHIGQSTPEVLSKSESFALRAVSIVTDAYSLTTLGTVLLAKAAYAAQVDVAEYYDRAMAAFDAAIAEDPANIVTWLAFLRYCLDVLKRVQNSSSRDEIDLEERLNDDWLRIHSRISSVANTSDATRMALDGLMRRYRLLTAGDSAEDAAEIEAEL
jgi:SIR2-like domain